MTDNATDLIDTFTMFHNMIDISALVNDLCNF